MAQEMAIGETKRQHMAASMLPSDEVPHFKQLSDVAGFTQLLFHGSLASVCMLGVHWARTHMTLLSFNDPANWALVFSELALGFVAAFYFTGFHECIHATAFKTNCLNKLFSHLIGFGVFRGANWFWCFHWMHHRYTQDPEKDPELSGGSSDLFDPSKSICAYLRFMTGWPFGFERTFGMAKMACGLRLDPWVRDADMETTVRVEAAIYVLLYCVCASAAVLNAQAREVIVWYWLLPHILGAGHLRFYQFCEHRACEKGVSTDLDAWGSTRTTATWYIYRRLAWNMPFHVEHHAWPATPFHLLPELHARIKDTQPESRCLIKGNGGYLSIHADFLRRVWRGEPTVPVDVPHIESDSQGASSPNSTSFAVLCESLDKFTMAQVAQHNSKDDLWVVIDGFVIDATKFLPQHPGGETVLVGKAGQDATKPFRMIHPEGTLERHLPVACLKGSLAQTNGVGLKESLLPK